MKKITEKFNHYFEVVPADTKELLEEAYRIRYQVLCVEEQVPDFEMEKFPTGIEKDIYDQRSLQCLLRYRPTGEFIGAVRLILSDASHPDQPFPIEEFAGRYFDAAAVQFSEFSRTEIAEISRLVVIREFRAGSDENKYSGLDSHSPKNGSAANPRTSPLPFLGLLVAIMRMTREQGITHWYAGMEPALHKRLARIGLDLTPIGPPLEYHGTRRPYLGEVRRLMDSIHYKHRAIWELITDNGTIWPAPKTS